MSRTVTFENKFMHRPTVSFPRALKRYTSSQVLIEEFEDAVPLEAFLANGGGAYDHRIANLGLDAFLVRPLLTVLSHSSLIVLPPRRTCSSSTTSSTRIFTFALPFFLPSPDNPDPLPPPASPVTS